MLGQAVVEEARKRGHLVMALTRSELDFLRIGGADSYTILRHPDVVINCAGLVPAHPDFADPTKVVRVNSLAPHVLAQWSKRLIHVSTDCVFSGVQGPYTEVDIPSPTDFYGATKLAGEVHYGPHLTVRTSFIGMGPRGLLAWCLGQPQNAAVEGWTNAIWSGLTTTALARYLLDVAMRPEITGILNIAGDPICKHDLLCLARDVFRPDITITQSNAPYVDRSLSPQTMHALGLIKAAPHSNMMKEMAWQTVSAS